MEEKIIKEAKISVAALVCKIIIDFFAMCILIGFVWIFRDIIEFFTTKLTITSKKLIGHTGLVNTNQLDSPLNKISGIQIKQGPGGKMFNYGTICVSTASTVFRFNYISDPNEFRRVLNEQIEAFDESRIEKQAKKLAEAVKN